MTPSERVNQYIRDWHECWRKCGGDDEVSADALTRNYLQIHEKWEALIGELSQKHWADDCEDDSASSFGTPPRHDPAVEKVRHEIINGELAIVETVAKDALPEFHEYRLKRENGQWRITSVLEFYDDKDDVAFSSAEIDRVLAEVETRAALPMHERGDEPNCEVLFRAGHRIKGSSMQSAEPIVVQSAGKLSLPTGTLVIQDFGYSIEDALPLSLRVPPGDYNVELCLLHGRVAATRVVFSPEGNGPFVYRRAVRAGTDDSMVGVDGGNVAICDARAFMSRTNRQHTLDQERWRQATLGREGAYEPHAFLGLAGSSAANSVIVSSGYGDGSYPVFWVFDTQERLVSLVVDFLVAAEFQTRSVRLAWKPAISGVIHDASQTGGFVVRVDRQDDFGVVVNDGNVQEIRWLDRSGSVIASSAEVGSWVSSDEHGWNVDLAKLDRSAVEMEIVLYTGYRNQR